MNSRQRGRSSYQDGLARVISRVLLEKLFLVFRKVVGRKDRIRRARRNAGAAVDAARRINIELRSRFELLFVFLWMNAVGGTDLDAQLVFNAAIGNHVGHDALLDSRVFELRSKVIAGKQGRL